jgi:hypothetical protein
MDDEETPNYFYKYRSLSGENRERTLLSIVHGALWFSRPPDFKDKNDCKIPVSFDTTPEKFRAYADTALSAVEPYLSGSEKMAFINDAIEKRVYADPDRIDGFRNWHENHIMQRGVLSLCSTNVSDRMWCEHADNHRGCCLEFRKSQKGMFANVEKARYEEKLPTVNNYEMSHVEMNDTIMLTKLEEYEFESEWRIWNPRGRGYWKYNAGDLTGLIFGRLITEEDKKLLTYLLKRSHPAAKLYEVAETGSGLKIITSLEELSD